MPLRHFILLKGKIKEKFQQSGARWCSFKNGSEHELEIKHRCNFKNFFLSFRLFFSFSCVIRSVVKTKLERAKGLFCGRPFDNLCCAKTLHELTVNSLVRLKCPNYSRFLSTNWQLQSPESLAGFSCIVRFNERYKHHKKINFNTANCNKSRRLLLIISRYLSNEAKWNFWQCSITEQAEIAILPARTRGLGRLIASCFLRYTYVWSFVAN